MLLICSNGMDWKNAIILYVNGLCSPKCLRPVILKPCISWADYYLNKTAAKQRQKLVLHWYTGCWRCYWPLIKKSGISQAFQSGICHWGKNRYDAVCVIAYLLYGAALTTLTLMMIKKKLLYLVPVEGFSVTSCNSCFRGLWDVFGLRKFNLQILNTSY